MGSDPPPAGSPWREHSFFHAGNMRSLAHDLGTGGGDRRQLNNKTIFGNAKGLGICGRNHYGLRNCDAGIQLRTTEPDEKPARSANKRF